MRRAEDLRVPDQFSSYSWVERDGLHIATRQRLNFQQGPGVRLAMNDARTDDKVTVRASKRAIGAMSQLSSAEGIGVGSSVGWVTVSYDTEVYNMGGVTIVGTRGAGTVGHQVDVTGVWGIKALVMYNAGNSANYYAGLHCDNTSRYGTNNPNLSQAGPIADLQSRLPVSAYAYLDAGDTIYVRTYNGHTGSQNLYYSANDTLSHIALEYIGEPSQLLGYDYQADNITP